MKTINIIVISPTTKGGSWLSTKQLLDRLNDYLKNNKVKVNIIVITARSDQKLEEKDLIHVELKEVDLTKLQDSPLSMFIFSFKHMFMGPFAFIFSLLMRPRILIVNGIVPLFFFIPYSLFNKKPFIILEYHGFLKNISIPKLMMLFLRMLLSKVVDIAISNSEASRDDLSSLLPRGKIIVFEHPINNIYFTDISPEEARRQLNLEEDDFIITYVGHLTFEKGIDIFARVVAEIARKKPSMRIKFLVVGDGKLSFLIRYLERSTSILRYEGYISNPAQLALYYAASDLVWSYADETYLARPAAEALAIGTPVIIPNVPAVLWKRLHGRRISDNLLDKCAGFIVPADDVDNIVNLILDLSKNRDILKTMRTCARRYALKKYNPLRLEILVHLIVKKYVINSANEINKSSLVQV